ncbi:MAG TPA: peptidoglycan-binding domain-containing protein [Humisphaera sp.]
MPEKNCRKEGAPFAAWRGLLALAATALPKRPTAVVLWLSVAVGGTAVTVRIADKSRGGGNPASHAAAPPSVGSARPGAPDGSMSARAPAIEVALLPAELRGDGTAESAARNLGDALRDLSEAQASVECCVALLDATVGRGRETVNTLWRDQPPSFATRSRARSVQVCLSSIGRYDGSLDGDPASLAQPVMRYQRENGLRPDGVVGGRTWTCLRAEVLLWLDLQGRDGPPQSHSRPPEVRADSGTAPATSGRRMKKRS